MVAVALAAAALPTYRDPPWTNWTWVADVVVGLSALVLAEASWRRSPVTSSAALVAAACWWAGTLWPVALYWHRAALVFLVLAVPRRWPRSRAAGVVIVVGCLVTAINPLWQWNVVALTLSVAVVVAAAVEATRPRSTVRLVASMVFAAAVCGTMGLRHLGADVSLLLRLYDALIVGVLAAVSMVGRGPSRAALTDLAVDLRPAPVPDAAALADLVGGELGLVTDPDLTQALASARRLHLSNESVRAQVDRAIEVAARARHRLVLAEASERARLAADLTASTAGPLAELVRRADEVGVAAAPLRRAATALNDAVNGLRSSALQHGLAGAVRSMPLVGALAVELDLDDGRCDDAVGDALYAVAAEALTNVSKHAGPCRVSIVYRLTGDRARLTVADTGRGGADYVAGTGLVGLADRIEALGGEIDVDSVAGRGTTVTASVPLVAWAAQATAPRRLSAGGMRAVARSSLPMLTP